MSSFIDLSNRVTVVTGGSRGIGEAVAREVAKAGSHVAIFDLDGDDASRTAASIARESNVKGRGYRVDVRRAEVLRQMMDVVAQDFRVLVGFEPHAQRRVAFEQGLAVAGEPGERNDRAAGRNRRVVGDRLDVICRADTVFDQRHGRAS